MTGLTEHTAYLICGVFTAAMIWVVFTDLRWRIIPNWLVLGLLGLYPVAVLWASPAPSHTLLSVIVAGVLFLMCFFAFNSGWMGGGDAKLIPVVGLWLGAGLTVPFLVYATALGGIITAGYLLRHRASPSDQPLVVPYGPAIAVAALALFPNTDWAAVLT